MCDYPVEGKGFMSEVWHGRKMSEELPPEIAPPTAENQGRVFWINELLECFDRSYYYPERFFYIADELWAEGHDVVAGAVSLHFSSCYSLTPCFTERIYDSTNTSHCRWGAWTQTAAQGVHVQPPVRQNSRLEGRICEGIRQ